MMKTADIDGKGLMVVQSAVWDNRCKVLPTVPRNVSDVHNVVESVEHVPIGSLHYDPGVDSPNVINEYQGDLLEVKTTGACG